MSNYDIGTYGDRIADLYDLLETPSLDTDGAVAFLAGVAGSGPVLELGVGTGRLALPLRERGLEVHGIEASKAMIEKLRTKPGGEAITVIEGDFAEVAVPASYSLIFAAFNTFSALSDQETQIRCLANVARALTPTGVAVIEDTVPDPQRLSKDQDIQLRFIDADLVVLHMVSYDSVDQRIVGQYVVLSDGSLRTFPVQTRYTWPSELDLMARLGGLCRCNRWAGWHREPFDATSKNHISVYRLREK